MVGVLVLTFYCLLTPCVTAALVWLHVVGTRRMSEQDPAPGSADVPRGGRVVGPGAYARCAPRVPGRVVHRRRAGGGRRGAGSVGVVPASRRAGWRD